MNTVAADRPLLGKDLAGRLVDAKEPTSHQLPQNRCLAAPRSSGEDEPVAHALAASFVGTWALFESVQGQGVIAMDGA